MAKQCPKCGAAADDDDVFCETDGARLTGVAGGVSAAGASATGRGGTCPGCAAAGTDDGDGYCSACGHRLAKERVELPSGAIIGRFTIVRPRASDDGHAKGADGGEALVTRASAETLVEARALVALSGESRFPTIVEDVRDELLALTLPRGRVLAECAASLDAAACVVIVKSAIAIAESLEARGLAWSPRADDFHLDAEHGLGVARLRGARALADGERIDVQLALEALGQVVLPAHQVVAAAGAGPCALAPPPLVRMLVTSSPPHHRARTVEDARALVSDIERSLDLPKEDGPFIAGLTDIGVRHAHNEDAVAVATGGSSADPWVVMIVCDGVSSSTSAEQASSIASKTACDALAHFARSGDTSFESTTTSMSEAIRAAHVAVCASTLDVKSEDPPGSTIVCALIHRRRLTVGWLGDSRAYWITKRGGELLTRDHSWVNETVDRGEMTEEEALRSPLAHALTKCLGPLEDPKGQVRPSARTRDLAGPGHLLLCSDGVWNYFSTEELVALVGSAPEPATPPVIARWLVNRALARGGHDNASVAVYHHK